MIRTAQHTTHNTTHMKNKNRKGEEGECMIKDQVETCRMYTYMHLSVRITDFTQLEILE